MKKLLLILLSLIPIIGFSQTHNHIPDAHEVSVYDNVQDNIKIYPNPVPTILTLTNIEKYDDIIIKNIQYKDEEKIVKVTLDTMIVDLTELRAGMYIIILKGKENVIKFKIIKY